MHSPQAHGGGATLLNSLSNTPRFRDITIKTVLPGTEYTGVLVRILDDCVEIELQKEPERRLAIVYMHAIVSVEYRMDSIPDTRPRRPGEGP